MQTVRRDREWLIAATIAAIPGSMIAAMIVHSMSAIRPLKLDLYIYQIDAILGFQPSFAMGRFLQQHTSLRTAALIAYDGLPFAMVAAILLYAKRGWEALPIIKAFTVNLFAALLVYLIVPVAGPRYAFSSFPAIEPAIIPHWMYIDAPPNCIPSVHFSTALLIYLFARRSPIGRMLSWLYLLLTFAATLGFGEHYLFDLIIAVPYAALIWRMRALVWFPRQYVPVTG
jgi:hypothetical protein